MKKILSLILCFLMILPIFALSSCSILDGLKSSTTSSSYEDEEDDTPIVEELRMASLIIDTDHFASIDSKDYYTSCKITLTNCKSEYAFDELSAGIRLRGNSTLNQEGQDPYRIKFDSKQSMLGLNDGAKCKSWVLLLPDINNFMAFSLAKQILGVDGYYSSDYTYVNVYLNGAYHGVYLLCEQSQINKNRVDVYEPKDGYTGTDIGYLLEIDNYPQDEVYVFQTNFGDVTLTDIEGGTLNWMTLKTDGTNIHKRSYTFKNDYLNQTQIQFVKNYINSVFTIAYYAINYNYYVEANETYTYYKSSSIKDAKELISKYIDIESVVDMYILQEFTKNTDVGAGSFYMSVDFSANSKRTRLTFECPWDFSWAFYSTSRLISSRVSYEGLSACTFCSNTFYKENASRKDRSNPWLILFMKADWFRKMVNERYEELLEQNVFQKSIEEVELIASAYADQFEKEKELWGYDTIEEINNIIYYSKNRAVWLKDKFAELAEIEGTK